MFESHEEWWDLLCILDLPQVRGGLRLGVGEGWERAEVERRVVLTLCAIWFGWGWGCGRGRASATAWAKERKRRRRLSW